MCSMVCLQDFEDHALKILPKTVVDFYRGGAGSEETLKNRRKTYLRLKIRPKVLQNVKVRNLSTTILGKKLSMPIGISPTAMHKLAHLNGECATVCAVESMDSIFILSTVSTSSIEEVAAAAPLTTKWFQLYIYKDREVTKDLIKRAEKAGFEALVLTVDLPVLGQRRADIRNKFSLPPHLTFANFDIYKSIVQESSTRNLSEYIRQQLSSSIEWNDIKWLQSITILPIILKGILTAEDALQAASLNVAGIFVSDHGGRQLDTAVTPIEALPEIVKAVGDKVEVYLDGGVREGIDVFKALALGAKMVFVGRPALWSLACNGQEGVKQMLTILRNELDETFALTGCTSIQSIKRDMVVHENHYSHL